jgi:hypothetical protein
MLISGVMMAIGLGIVSLGSVPFLGTLIAMMFVVVVTALITFVQWVSDLPYSITRGFRIEIWEMLLLYLGIALLLWGLLEKERRLLYSSIAIFTLFIGNQSIQSIRDEHKQEFSILNNNDPTFLIRRGKTADLIVVSNKPDIESRTTFLKRALDIYYGVDTKMHFLYKKRGSLQSPDSEISFTLKSGLIQFTVRDKTFALVYGDYFKDQDVLEVEQLIAGPWVNRTRLAPFLDSIALWELKKQGALHLAL